MIVELPEDAFKHAPLLQRATFAAAAVKHRFSRSAQHDPKGLELELSELALQLCTELEIAQHRVARLVEALHIADRYLAGANPEASRDIRALELGRAELGRALALERSTCQVPLQVGMDGSVHPARWTPDDPFAAMTGHVRIRQCVHCGRTCGDYLGGSGVVNGQPVCHPNGPDRPDCYRMVSIHQHPLHDCDTCTKYMPDPIDDRTMP